MKTYSLMPFYTDGTYGTSVIISAFSLGAAIREARTRLTEAEIAKLDQWDWELAQEEIHGGA